MKGYFIRKPMNIEELEEETNYSKANGYKMTPILVEAKMEFTPDLYDYMVNHFMDNYEFFIKHAEVCCFENKGAHCVLITAEGRKPLAVCLEGYHYFRYVAIAVEE